MNDRKNNIKKNIDKTKPVRKPVKGNFARENTTGAGRKKADYRQVLPDVLRFEFYHSGHESAREENV